QSLTTWFADLIKTIKPTIVHTHHYAHLGLEYLRIIKQIDPSIHIYITLHEYMAICLHDGQMIKKGDFKLCSRESFDECQRCFPEKTSEDFWLRKHIFQTYFKLADGFIAPSEFLRQRYIAWGLKPEQIIVIENGQADKPALAPRLLHEGETRNRFAYFGQITQYKGLDIILEALQALPKEERKKIVLEVHGANLEYQPQAFKDKIENLRTKLIKEGVVQWVGAYQPYEISDRMAGIDWVIVPSVWWENSPMVIQEAFIHGKPVICSNIGGMAEKVQHNIDGLHVPAGNVFAWQNTLRRVTQDELLWNTLHSNIKKPLSYQDCAEQHFNFFK
ncbi:MAG: glycosyltransferase, partial [Methylococcaceae bacterium]